MNQVFLYLEGLAKNHTTAYVKVTTLAIGIAVLLLILK